MRFREVERNIDRINEEAQRLERERIEREGYLKIKSETETTEQEVKDFWNNMFM